MFINRAEKVRLDVGKTTHHEAQACAFRRKNIFLLVSSPRFFGLDSIKIYKEHHHQLGVLIKL